MQKLQILILKSNYPHGLINASENHVGLPDGQMGNSEVGHINIGAGQMVSGHQKINNSKTMSYKIISPLKKLNELKKIKEDYIFLNCL